MEANQAPPPLVTNTIGAMHGSGIPSWNEASASPAPSPVDAGNGSLRVFEIAPADDAVPGEPSASQSRAAEVGRGAHGGYDPLVEARLADVGEDESLTGSVVADVREQLGLAVVEVKRRSTLDQALSALGPDQYERLLDAGRAVLRQRPSLAGHLLRIDIVALAPRRFPRHRLGVNRGRG